LVRPGSMGGVLVQFTELAGPVFPGSTSPGRRPGPACPALRGLARRGASARRHPTRAGARKEASMGSAGRRCLITGPGWPASGVRRCPQARRAPAGPLWAPGSARFGGLLAGPRRRRRRSPCFDAGPIPDPAGPRVSPAAARPWGPAPQAGPMTLLPLPLERRAKMIVLSAVTFPAGPALKLPLGDRPGLAAAGRVSVSAAGAFRHSRPGLAAARVGHPPGF